MELDRCGDWRARAHVAASQLSRQPIVVAAILMHRYTQGRALLAGAGWATAHVYYDVQLIYYYVHIVVHHHKLITARNVYVNQLHDRADQHIDHINGAIHEYLHDDAAARR